MAPDAPCGSGNGTLEKPWCIQDALESRRVKPGDTIEARLGGTYKLREMAGGFVPITATLAGSPDRRITVKPYAPDQTTPTTLIRIACDQRSEDKGVECMSIESSWVDYYDFEVANFGDPQRQRTTGQFDSAGFGTGVRVFADAKKNHGVGNRLINWVMHDTASGVFKSDRANPTDFYGMVVYNYGFLYSLEKVRRIGGHGFYLRNGIEANGRLKNCTSRSGVDDSQPARVSLIDNIVSGAIVVKGYGAASLSYQDYGTCECVMHRNELFEGNFFLGGTLSGGCPATNDATLGTRDQTLKSNWWSSYTAGYNAAGCDGVTLDGNFMFRPMHSDGDKYFANRSAVYFAQRRGKDTNPCRPGVTFTNNTYWGNVDLVEEEGRGRSRARHHQRISGRVVRRRRQRLPAERPAARPELHGRPQERLPPRLVQRVRGEFPGRRRRAGRPLDMRPRRWSALRDPVDLQLHGSARGHGNLCGGGAERRIPDDPGREPHRQLRRPPGRRRSGQLSRHAALVDEGGREHLPQRVRGAHLGRADARGRSAKP